MLVVVVVLFGICWLPLHTFILVLDFNPKFTQNPTPEAEEFMVGIYYTVHWLAMSNSFVNPIIYGFLNDSFRVRTTCYFSYCIKYFFANDESRGMIFDTWRDNIMLSIVRLNKNVL